MRVLSTGLYSPAADRETAQTPTCTTVVYFEAGFMLWEFVVVGENTAVTYLLNKSSGSVLLVLPSRT